MTPGTDDGLDEHERLPWGLSIVAAFAWAGAAVTALLTIGLAWHGLWVPAGVGAIGTVIGVRVARVLSNTAARTAADGEGA